MRIGFISMYKCSGRDKNEKKNIMGQMMLIKAMMEQNPCVKSLPLYSIRRPGTKLEDGIKKWYEIVEV